MSLKLQIDKKTLVLTLLVLPVLMSLGFWQLSRAEEKRTIQAAFNKQKRQEPVTWQTIKTIQLLETEKIEPSKQKDQLAFLPVVLNGEFHTEHTLLLDNKIHQGKVGYQVLQPFLIQELMLSDELKDKSIEETIEVEKKRKKKESWVLVNRGWIAAPRTRDEKPQIPKATVGITTLQAEVYVPPGEAYMLDEQNYEHVVWPLVIQNVEIKKLSKLLKKDLFSYELRLQETDPNLLQANWQPISVQPEKHVAYAFQWFAMSAGLVMWFVFANTNLWQWITRKDNE